MIMAFSPAPAKKDDDGLLEGRISTPTTLRNGADKSPSTMTSMDIDTPTVRLSPKNASTAKMMYDISPTNLEKTMDGITDDHDPYKNKTKIRAPKTPKPRVPTYNKQEKGSCFLYLANVVRFEQFANDVQALNPTFVSRGRMDTLWYKTLRTLYANWKDPSMTPEMKRKVLKKANSQTAGYEGFDAKAYWELQNMANGMDGLSVVKEVEAKNPHFKAMELARQKKKAERRRVVDAKKKEAANEFVVEAARRESAGESKTGFSETDGMEF
ncbi:hypothetical protein VTL71DRAFT_776 [Oculimacula yallundae]|uniref:Uncharacterized protein n=1 Tax=Oculimacula yallundae TaxID=86028 RepID=A0ABR4D2H9_9HELO